MRTAQRTSRQSRPRRTLRHARRRVYVGSTVTRRESSRVFFARTTQQMAARTALADWLGGAFMVCGFIGWGALIVFFGS
jgi:hypothetical protein